MCRYRCTTDPGHETTGTELLLLEPRFPHDALGDRAFTPDLVGELLGRIGGRHQTSQIGRAHV